MNFSKVKKIQLNKPADDEKVSEVVLKFRDREAVEIPKVLISLWKLTSGFSFEYGEVYSPSDLFEQYEELECREYCPGFIAIANDVGNKVVLIELKSSKIYLNYMSDMKADSMELLANDLIHWIENGCPFSTGALIENSLYNPLTRCSIFLDKIPDDGLKGLLKIKNLLNINDSIVELKSKVSSLPCELLVGVTYAKSIILFNKLESHEKQFISIRPQDDLETILSTSPDFGIF